MIGGIKTFKSLLPYVKNIYGTCIFKTKEFEKHDDFENKIKENFTITDVSDFKWNIEANCAYKEVLFKRKH